MKLTRRLFAAAFAALAFSAPAVAQDFPDDAKILDMMKARIADGRAHAMIIGLIEKNGARRILMAGDPGPGRPPLSADSVFEIGSVTKTFTATLLADMAQKGEVKLDAPAQDYAPKGLTLPQRNDKQITLLSLSEQNSGLPRLPGNMTSLDLVNPYADYDVAKLNAFLNTYQLPRDPGATFEYSNLGVGLLGYLLSNKAGQSYEALVKARITGPLSMKDTGVTLTPKMQANLVQGHGVDGKPNGLWDLNVLAGAGALRSTMNDMLAYLDAQLGEPKTDIERAMRTAHAPRATAMGRARIGLNWITITTPGGRTLAFHDGGTGGYGALVAFDAERQVGVVMLQSDTMVAADIGLHLLDPAMPLAPKPAPPVAHVEIQVPRETMAKYVGVYAMDAAPAVRFTVTLEADGLQVQLTQQPKVAVFAEASNKFFYKVVDAQLVFTEAADGKPAYLVLHQNGAQQKATKIE